MNNALKHLEIMKNQKGIVCNPVTNLRFADDIDGLALDGKNHERVATP